MERKLRTELESQLDYTTARVDRMTERRLEEEDNANIFFKPDLAFMVNDGPSSCEEAL